MRYLRHHRNDSAPYRVRDSVDEPLPFGIALHIDADDVVDGEYDNRTGANRANLVESCLGDHFTSLLLWD